MDEDAQHFLPLLSSWIMTQRWYQRSARPAHLTVSAHAHQNGLSWLLVRDDAEPDSPRLYQVPLTSYPEPIESLSSALVGVLEDADRSSWIYDAPHDPRFVAVLLNEETRRSSAAPHTLRIELSRPATSTHSSFPLPSTGLVSAVIAGEQSNTSIIVHGAPGIPGMIIKLFRMIQPGQNPDIELQSLLSLLPERCVPLVFGWVDGSWEGGRASIAFIQEFLADSRDAWEIAHSAAERHEPFLVEAHELGRATARMHAQLRTALGMSTPSEQWRNDRRALLIDTADSAIREIPALGSLRQVIIDKINQLHSLESLALQRVHGDLHLGQILSTPNEEWVFLDFEGEPLRTISERREPDSYLRDVAGMLRSFDYASVASSTESAAAWSHATRTRFLAGYTEIAGDFSSDELVALSIFEIDKALYECVYESRNRPDWLPIPLSAINRLLSGTIQNHPNSQPTATTLEA